MWKVVILFSLVFVHHGHGAPQPQAAGSAIAPMPMPVPPPMQPGPCIEEGATGFINDTCQKDTDCYDSNMMTCTNKKCQCAKDYVEDPSLPKGSKQRICSSLPSLLSACTTTCQKPYECKSASSSEIQAAGIFFMTGTSGKICLCPGKAKYVNGYCDAGCKTGQRIGSKGECVARCGKNEMLIDGDCKKLAGIGEACTDSLQCTAAFSTCQSGKCACTDGFSAQGSKCVPKTYSCPYGDPLKKGDSVVQCEGSSSYPICVGGMCPMFAAGGRGGPAPPAAAPTPQAAAVNQGGGVNQVSPASMPVKAYKTDSCPATHYCETYDYVGSKARGHCCPKPAGKCPVGEAHPTAQCGPGGPQCPYTTHMCVSAGAPNDYSNQICCPKPCNGYEKVYVKDQCLPIVQYGDGCQQNEQCQSINGVCSGGKCTCGPKASAVDLGSGNKYCQLSCDSDEVAVGAECKSRLKVGDSCTPETGMLCPSGAYCNSKGKCGCLCGYQKINDKFCAPAPTCPSGPPSNPSTPFPNLDLKKQTFCKLDGTGKPPLSAVDSCPGKTYCSWYVENMGVCCPKPEPFCPDGSKPTSKSNCHNNGMQCGPNEMCNIYYTAATSKSGAAPEQGSVCCPMNPPPNVMIPPMPMSAPGAAGVSSSASSGPK